MFNNEAIARYKTYVYNKTLKKKVKITDLKKYICIVLLFLSINIYLVLSVKLNKLKLINSNF